MFVLTELVLFQFIAFLLIYALLIVTALLSFLIYTETFLVCTNDE